MQKQPDTLNPIRQINSGARIPAVRLVKGNPKSAALMSKLVVDYRSPTQQDIMQRQGAGINTSGLRVVAQEGMRNVNDNETVHQLLADTELASQILTSVILSPKDMMGVDVGYKSELTHWTIPHEVNSAMTNAVRTYFEEVYKIKPRLPVILDQVLFKRGSYPVAVLPENAIDDLIHGNGSVTTESLKSFVRDNGRIESLGILGPTDEEKKATDGQYGSGIGLALEHLLTHQPNKNWSDSIAIKFENKDNRPEIFETKITVTDNLNVLKVPQLSHKLRQQKTRKVVTGRNTWLSAESIAQRINNDANPPMPAMTASSMVHKVFHKPDLSQTIVKEVKTQDKLKRRSVGMPLEIHFPSESVIPVHVPNQPANQIGFFVLLDPEGNPINRGQGINHYRELGQSLQNNSFASSMIQRAGLALSDNADLLTRGQGGVTMGRMYGQMLERDLMQRLKNGLPGGNVTIAGNDEVYRLMLARSLSNQQTQILYIPADYMTYVAFEYHTNGTGKSLLDNTKIIDSMQAMLLVGTVMGALKNSVGRTHVDLELDESTPDPWKAIETMMGEIQRVNGNGFPLGTVDPLDIKDGLIRSQFEFGFTGHPRLPNMKVDFTERNSNYQPPDSKIMEDLRKRRLMAFYLTPEQVDAASGADYATSVANNSTLLSKRAMVLQQEFTPQISAHLRKHAINSADLVDQLVEIINGSYKDIVKEFKDDEAIELFSGTKVTKQELESDPLTKAQFIRELIEDFIGGFSMTLPEPDTTKLDNLNDLYRKQSELVEEALKAWVSEDMMDATIVGEEVAGAVRIAAAQIKAYLLREWQIKHGLLPELAKLTARDEEGEVELDLPEIQASHNEAIMGIITALVTANKKAKEASAKAFDKAGINASDSGYGGGGDDYGSGGSADGGSDPMGGGAGDDLMGGMSMDFGLDGGNDSMDMGMGDPPAESGEPLPEGGTDAQPADTPEDEEKEQENGEANQGEDDEPSSGMTNNEAKEAADAKRAEEEEAKAKEAEEAEKAAAAEAEEKAKSEEEKKD